MKYDLRDPLSLFKLNGLVAAITGGGGILCSVMAEALSAMGVAVAVLDLSEESANRVADKLNALGGKAMGVACDVTDRDSMAAACEKIVAQFGKVDILINGAGGNHPRATTTSELAFYDLDVAAFEKVFRLNIVGTIVPSMVFGKQMAAQKSGVIINIASVNSIRPLTRVPAYSAAKAGVSNFTQWLAVHMAQEYCPDIRVNAIAPGFFLTEQNRFLLTDKETGAWTERGEKILEHTPMAKFGVPEDLVGVLIWLVSPAAGFVTGSVVSVDGGFCAFSGV